MKTSPITIRPLPHLHIPMSQIPMILTITSKALENI